VNELKQAMHEWFNLSPDVPLMSFTDYFEMNKGKLYPAEFKARFFELLAELADEQGMLAIDCPAYSKQLLIEQLEINNMLTERLANMTDAAINPPVVLKTDADVIEQRKQFNKAIELLEACSEELFMISGRHDIGRILEKTIDEFLKEVKP